MSMFGRTDWTAGFPFTSSRLREGARRTPTGAGITRAGIEDEGQPVAPPAPRPAPGAMRPRGAAAARATLPEVLPLPAAPPARRYTPRQGSLRLLPLGAFFWGSRANPPQPRTRPDHVLIWVTAGRLRLDLPRRGQILVPGEIRYLPAGTAFAARPQSGAEGHVLLLSPEMVAHLDPAMPAAPVAGSVGDQAGPLLVNLTELVTEAARSHDRGGLICHLNMLSLRLSRLEPAPSRDAASAPEPDRPLVDRFLALALQDLSPCRTLADLAQELGTTLTALDRACRAARGRRAIDLVNELRLERAAELLRHSEWTSARIAQELGYCSQTHFARAFVAATGRTPDIFRAQLA